MLIHRSSTNWPHFVSCIQQCLFLPRPIDKRMQGKTKTSQWHKTKKNVRLTRCREGKINLVVSSAELLLNQLLNFARDRDSVIKTQAKKRFKLIFFCLKLSICWFLLSRLIISPWLMSDSSRLVGERWRKSRTSDERHWRDAAGNMTQNRKRR